MKIKYCTFYKWIFLEKGNTRSPEDHCIERIKNNSENPQPPTYSEFELQYYDKTWNITVFIISMNYKHEIFKTYVYNYLID